MSVTSKIARAVVAKAAKAERNESATTRVEKLLGLDISRLSESELFLFSLLLAKASGKFDEDFDMEIVPVPKGMMPDFGNIMPPMFSPNNLPFDQDEGDTVQYI